MLVTVNEAHLKGDTQTDTRGREDRGGGEEKEEEEETWSVKTGS